MVSELITAAVGVAGLVVGAAVGFLGCRQFASEGTGSETPLSRPARRLDTEPDVEPVTGAIETLVETLETIERSAELPQSVDVSRSDPPAVRASAIEQAVTNRDVVVTTPDGVDESYGSGPAGPDATDSGSTADRADSGPGRDVSEAAEAVKTDRRPRTRTAERLLNYLSDPETAQRRQIEDTLRTVVGTLDEYDRLTDVLSDVDRRSFGSERDATALRDDLTGVDSDAARGVTHLCERHVETLDELHTCQSAVDEYRRTADAVCSAAAEQTAFEPAMADSANDRLADLSESVDRGAIGFHDESETVGSVATEVERTVAPESTLAREFVGQLADRRTTSDHEFEATLTRVLESLDEAETVRHRLDNIDRAEVTRLADRLRDELDESTTVEALLRDRVTELAETVERANDADTVVVYAARQELRYYDRTFLPTFNQTDSPTQNEATVDRRLSEVEQRRSDIRTNYPSRYPEHNHTIPIHFLDLVETLHGEASDAANAGEFDRANGLLAAAEHTLDSVEKLYERHAYSALLQQLRG